ncbi:MAG TPA: hypothetical protein VK985_09555 [Rariglobus sp.]|nr:hypothetical protein [Rariglobus sp.]
MKKISKVLAAQLAVGAYDINATTPLGVDLGEGRNPAGLICAANEARFTSGHYSEQMTGYTVGWKDPEKVDEVLQRLFPEVPVSRRFDFKKAKNAQAFLSELDDERPIGSPFKRVEYTGTSANEKTINKGLTVRIDHDQCEDLEAEKTLATERLMQRLARNELRRGIALLEANDATDAVVFDETTNPDGLVRAMLKASADVTGIRPNVVAFGETAFDLRLDAYEHPARENGASRADKTPEELARYFMVDHVEIVKARYQSTATAKAAIVPSTVYGYLAMPGIGKDDPSAVKRFTSKSRGGQRYGVYVVEHEKYTDVSVEMYSNIIATGEGIVSRTVAGE